MVKRFKLRLSRVISSLHSCRSKDPSNLPESPVPAYFMLSPLNPKALDIEFPAPQPPKRQVSSSIVSVGYGCTSRHGSGSTGSSPDQFRWKQEEKWHVVAREAETTTVPPRRKLYNSSVSDASEGGVSPCDPPQKTKKKIKQRTKKKEKKNSKSRVRFSTSSAESGWFSSSEGGDENETETLVSSSNKTFSTDSNSRETRVNPRRLKKVRKVSASKSKRRASSSELCSESPARLSVLFQRLMPCKAEGKVKESFAVVKKSENPYEDFKRSMLEMILAKQMFDTKDLEQLLHCFLSLNSRHHHPVIVQAFSDIWEILFCNLP